SSQISSLQYLNNQTGGNNSQLISQIRDVQATRDQLQSQVSQLQSQIGDLTEKLKLQQSRVIADRAQLANSPRTFVDLGSLTYSGYIRVSWATTSNAQVSFAIQEFDINITTPVLLSGVFSIPVSANATGNAWFSIVNCPEAGFCPGLPVVYSITYWY